MSGLRPLSFENIQGSMEAIGHRRKDLGHVFEGQIEESQESASGMCHSVCQEVAGGLRRCWFARKICVRIKRTCFRCFGADLYAIRVQQGERNNHFHLLWTGHCNLNKTQTQQISVRVILPDSLSLVTAGIISTSKHCSSKRMIYKERRTVDKLNIFKCCLW
jgi:hypothetical protein